MIIMILPSVEIVISKNNEINEDTCILQAKNQGE